MKALTTLLLLLLTIVATAQQKQPNTVYLKNGSVIKGIVLEDTLNGIVKIETADKSVWVFKKDEVDKIETNKAVRTNTDANKTANNKILKAPSDVDFRLKKGVFTQIQVDLMPSKKQSAEGTIPSLFGEVGYQIDKHFSAGLGTGIEAFHISMMPLFADARCYFLNDRYTPFISFKGGYAFPLENQKDVIRNVDMKSKGGWMGGIEIGYIRSLSNTTRFTFSLGYRYQHLLQTGQMDQYFYHPLPIVGTPTTYYKVDRNVSTDFNRIVIAIGIRFL